MKTIFFVFLNLTLMPLAFSAEKKSSSPKVQEVNFDEMALKGTIRNPDGAFLVQKSGQKFGSIVEVQKDIDERIRKTIEFIQ